MRNTPPLVAIVDDEESVRKALQRLIRSAGFAVETFPSGADFIGFVENHEPDCLVLDLHMPQVNGFEVQSHLIRNHLRLPIVVITGHDTPEARTRVMNLGASAYLRKPVDDMMLLAAINEAIAGSGQSAKDTGPQGNGA